MNLILVFFIFVGLTQCKTKHGEGIASKRSKVSGKMKMPRLGDIPENEEEDDNKDAPFLEGEAEKGELKKNQQKKVRSENAASFGNNVVSKPGINPSSASFAKKENHKGFHGHDKIVQHAQQKKKKNVVNNKKGRNTKDREIMSKLKNMAREIAEVEYKKEMNASKDENKKKRKSKESKNSADKDISMLNSLGRRNISHDLLANNKVDSFHCPWSCFWTCSAYCPSECCFNPLKCPENCKTICSPKCKDQCCAPGAKKLPKLQLSFSKPTVMKPVSPVIQTYQPYASPIQLNGYGTTVSEKIKILKEQSNYAASLLGFSRGCPTICSKVCTPIVCKRSCCVSPFNFNRQQYPVMPQTQTQYQRMYCPPICQTSCIEQCPNQCCSNLSPSPSLL